MTISQATAARFVKALAVTVVLGVALFTPLSLVVIPFLVLPAAYLLVRRELVSAAVLVVLTGALIFLLDETWAGVAVILALVILGGSSLAVSLIKQWSFRSGLAVVTSALVVWLVVCGVLSFQEMGYSLSGYTKQVNTEIGSWTTMLTNAGVSSTVAQQSANQARAWVHLFPYLLPGLVIGGGLALGACVIGLAYWLFRKWQVETSFSLSTYRLHWGLLYATIVGLALCVYAGTTGSLRDVEGLVGLNVLMITLTLFFFQGLAVVHWFATSRRLSKAERIMMYLLSVIFQIITAILGLFDMWLDCRKRYAVAGPRSGPAR